MHPNLRSAQCVHLVWWNVSRRSTEARHAQVLRALRAALAHDAGGALVSPARFGRLLPALVAQLGAEPDAAAVLALAAAIEADAAAAPEAALPALPAAAGDEDEAGAWGAAGAGRADHAYGRAAVAAVVQLAVAAGSDDLWKPLNHQVRGVGLG